MLATRYFRVQPIKRWAAALTELRQLLGQERSACPESEGANLMVAESAAAVMVPLVQERVFQSDPEILGGTPVFAGTRVPVQNLIDYLEDGESIGEFLEGFPTVKREQVIAFLELTRGLTLVGGGA